MEGYVEAHAALPAGAKEPVGRFVYLRSTDEWHWADAIYSMHGFSPGDVVPTLDLVLAHQHPEGREGCAQAMSECLATGKAFSFYYRLVDANKHERSVVMVGEPMRDIDRDIIGVRGYFIDLTESRVRETSVEAREAVAKASESRAVIEQAKGGLMLTYGIDATAAYVILAWRSQNDNIKLRDLAQRLVEVMESEEVSSLETRAHMDKVLEAIV